MQNIPFRIYQNSRIHIFVKCSPEYITLGLNSKKLKSYASFLTTRYETRNQSQEKKLEKNINTWRLNNMLLNNEWVNQVIKKEIKNKVTNENENTVVFILHTKILGMQQKLF